MTTREAHQRPKRTRKSFSVFHTLKPKSPAAEPEEMSVKKGSKKPDFFLSVAMLGLSESGKSTIVKNMKVIYKDSYREAKERQMHRLMISRYLLQQAKNIVNKVKAKAFAIDDLVQMSAARIIMHHMKEDTLPVELASDIKNVWYDYKVRVINKGLDWDLTDNAAHFLDSVERICSPDYVPTVTDILNHQTKTGTITETDFTVENTHMHVIDMGGQSDERTKWSKRVQEAGAIMYCVSLTDFETSSEGSNNMREALKTFEKILLEAKGKLVFLCFTKKTLFATKTKNVDLSVCFSDYQGGADYKAGIEFIMRKFSDVNTRVTGGTHKIYTSVINSTRTEDVGLMMKSAIQLVQKTDSAHLLSNSR